MNENIFDKLDFGPFRSLLDNDDITDISYDNGGQIWIRSLTQGSLRDEVEGATPEFVENVVNDIDNNVVDIVRKFKDAFKSVTAQREIKRKLRSILWVKYQIKDEDIFNKAYSYIEMYY